MIQAASFTYECQPVLQKKTYPNESKLSELWEDSSFSWQRISCKFFQNWQMLFRIFLRVIFASPIRLQFTPCIYITIVWLSRNKQRMFLPCRIIIGDGNLFVGGGAHFNGLYMCVGKWLCVYFNRRFRITCRQDVSFYILRRTTCYISTFSCLQKRESFLAKHGFGNLQNCLLPFFLF